MTLSDKSRRLAFLTSRISKLRSLLRDSPDDDRLLISLNGLSKRIEQARADLIDVAQSSSVEVIDYKIVQAQDRYPLRSVTESLGEFQLALTAVYDAVTNGPKAKAKYSGSVRAESELNFELFYPGSKGFLLSATSEANLFGGSLDRTADALASYLDISSSDEARDATRHLGLAAVHVLYRWVSVNANWQNSISYEWQARVSKRSGMLVPVEHFQMLQDVFQSADQTETKFFRASGILVGLDVAQRTFHFTVPDGETYKGKLERQFSGGEWSVPHAYVAEILEHVQITPATGDERVTYELVALR